MLNLQNKPFSVVLFIGLFALASVGVFVILPSLGLRLVFAALAAFVIIWSIKARQGIDINTLILLTAFVAAVAQYGFHFYFRLPGWLILIISFVWIWALFAQGERVVMGRMTTSGKIISLTAGLIGAEVSLALLFWPTHFLVNASVLFLLFYLAWLITYYYLLGLLNWHRIMVHVLFVGVFLSIILLTAQWKI